MKVKRGYEPLQKGDIVDILAPAFGISERDLKKIVTYLASIGLQARYPKTFLDGDLVCSAPEKVRFEQFKQAIHAEDSKAIWCVKGGGGSPQIIPYLNELAPSKQQKLFIGFSDITALHFFLTQKWNWQTVHGPVLWQVARNRIDEASITQIENLIFAREYRNEFELSPISTNIETSEIKAKSIIGGNLKLAQCSIGTIWELDAKDKILVFEDVNELPYHIDRILTHCIQSNLFEGAKAIIFGDFDGENIERDLPIIEKVIKRFAKIINIPVFRIEGIGHTERNAAIHFGVGAEINVKKDESSLLKINELE